MHNWYYDLDRSWATSELAQRPFMKVFLKSVYMKKIWKEYTAMLQRHYAVEQKNSNFYLSVFHFAYWLYPYYCIERLSRFLFIAFRFHLLAYFLHKSKWLVIFLSYWWRPKFLRGRSENVLFYSLRNCWRISFQKIVFQMAVPLSTNKMRAFGRPFSIHL